MTKLLKAEYSRLFKNKLFWVMTGLFAVFASFMRLYIYFCGIKFDEVIPTDAGFFSFAVLIGIAMAVFCSMFIGTEHSDGTIRNKIVVGHTRVSIYFSKLLVCISAGFLFIISYLIFTFGLGIPLSGKLLLDAKSFAITMILCLLLTIAYTSLFVMIGMMMQGKAAIAVTSVIIAFTMIFAASAIISLLNEPEMYDAYEYKENGITYQEDAHKNPNYLTGTKRQIVELLYDFLPGCQAIRLSGAQEDPDGNWSLAIYSGVIIVFTSAAGAFIFRKKDLK